MLSLFLAIALIFTMIGPSYAAVTDIVVQGAAGDTNLYQYDYAELNASYMNYLMGDTAGASLYLDFMNKTYPPVAFKDSEKGYVDYNDVSNAYMNALMSGSDWNTDNYTSTLAAPADMPPTVKATSVIGGEITTVDTPTSTTAITITAVTAIDPKTVDVGTGFKSLGLPTTNKVTYSDGTTADLAISEWGGDKYEKDIAGVYNLLAVLTLPTGVTYGEGVTGPTCKVTVVDSQAAIVAAAEGAVAAYEAAAITTAEEITAAEALEVTANEKAALVADADKKAAFEARIAAKKAAVDAAKAALVKLVVSSVSAINATTIEVTFNRAPAAEETLTYTVAGTAYTPVMDGAKATLTVATLVDDAATAVVINDGAADLYNATVTYDINEITTITIENNDFNKTIGQNFVATVKLADEDGDVMPNESVKLEAAGAYDTNSLEPAVELTATTDANGIATFTWTTAHDGFQNFEVYSVTKPVVRDDAMVTWTLADTSLVTVVETAAVSLSDGSSKEFNVTFKNANGSAKTTGDVFVDMDVTGTGGSAADTDFTVYVRDLSVADDTADNAWVEATSVSFAISKFTLDNAGAGQNVTADGKMRFLVVNASKRSGTNTVKATTDKLVPTFFYDEATTTVGTLQAKDPRAVGSAISYVAAIPTFTWAASTAETIAVGDTKEYTLTITDQYGKPFIGNAELTNVEAVDNLAGTINSAGTIKYAVNANGDSDYADTAVGADYYPNDIAAATISTNISIDTVPLMGTTEYVVEVSAGTNGLYATPLVYFDTNTNVAGYDAADAQATATKVTFATPALTSLTITEPTTKNATIAGTLDYKVEVKDQFGNAITPKASGIDIGFLLFDADGNEVAAGGDWFGANSLTATTNYSDGSVADAGAAGNEIFYLANGTDFAGNETDADVRITIPGATPAGVYTMKVFLDGDGTVAADQLLQGDETVYTYTFTVDAQVVDDYSLTSAGAGALFTADKTNGFDYVADEAANVTLVYTALDQSGNAVNVTADTVIDFTITNNGDDVITASGLDTANVTIGADEAKTVKKTMAANSNNATITINKAAGEEATVDVSAQITGNAATAKATDLLLVKGANKLANNGDRTISGTVKAYDTLTNTTDGLHLIVQTAFGYFYVNPTPAATKVTVDGNTGLGEAQLESTLTVGDTIVIVLDAVADWTADTYNLTNN